jgi:general secretion pathway protein H
MRGRLTGTRSGFTLIEMLVVLAVIGIITSVVLLSFGLTGRDRDLEKESDRLYARFLYAHEQAELQTRDYGVLFQDDGYEFLAFDVHRGIWDAVPDDDALIARTLPEGLGVKLSVDGRPVVLTRPKDAKDKTPQVMIYANGDLSSFAAALERDGGLRSVTLTQDDQGALTEQPLVEARP